jgi:PAS domain S-box-containing protein
MRWFANLKIHAKLLLSFLPLGLIVIGALLFASTGMERIEAGYNELLGHKVKAIMDVTRSNQRTIQINQELYELIAEEDADKSSRIEAAIENTTREFHELMAEAQALSPKDASRIAAVEELFGNFITETKVLRAKTQAKPEEALEFMRARVKPLYTLTRNGSAKLVDSMREALATASRTASENTEKAVRLTWLAVIFGLVLSLSLALSIAQIGIARPLQRLRDAIRDVAAGRHSQPVPDQGLANEVGQIARDLDVLREGVLERAVQSRLKAEAAALAEGLQVSQDFAAFAATVFSRLAEAVSLVYGALYLEEDGGRRFARVGGFAVDDPEAPRAFAMGEGLVGQCARDGRALEITDSLEAGGLGVRTGLGAITPRRLLALPIRHQHKTIAVLELGSDAPATEDERALLEAVLPVIALNLEILSANLATRRLLEQTRLQAESLAVSETQLIARKDQLQEALGEVEAVKARLVEMTDSLPVGVFQVVYPPQGRAGFVFASRQTRDILGVPPEDLLADAEAAWRHVRADDLIEAKASVAAAVARAQAGEAGSRGEMVLRLALGGQERFVLTNARYRLRAGGAVEANGFFQDITERKRAEDLAARARMEMTQIFNTAAGGMRVIDKDFTVLRVNDAYLELTGYAREEVEGRKCHEAFNSAACHTEACTLRRILGGEKRVALTVEKTRKDGAAIHCDLTATPLYTPSGELIGMIEDFRDVTEREAAAKAMEQARVLAEEANKAKSDFLARMSHEIRTPMNAVLGMSHLALQTELTAKQHDYISKIQASANNLLGIINDILDFSKIEAGKMDIEHIPFDLDETLDNAASVISLKAEEKDLEVIFDVGRDVPRDLVGDPLRLTQVLVNYANNAIKFTEKGHVLLAARLEETRADGTALLRFSVTDTGVGLTEAQIDRLFQSFSQADGSTTRKYGGTGLGLAICKRLANLMGGEVGVTSEPGKGSTFWFTIAVGLRSQAERPDAFVPAVDLRRMRCLVADDNPEMRRILAETLESFSFRVETAPDGLAALEALRRAAADDPFKLVLLDWKMPGLDGNEVARRITENPDLDVSRILMITGYGREEVMREASRAGVSAFLVKPVGASTLFDTIMEVFGKRVEKRLRGTKKSAVDKSALDGIRGASVLLAEDNEINQQVATELLRQAGLTVTVVDTGRRAVEAATAQAFDLALMDIQMPEMDGLEAARRIRASGAPWAAAMPIIAMTAHAMAGDREKSLEAGMNDHLPKPIDPDELVRALLRWIAPGKRQPPPEAATAEAAPPPDDLPLAGLPGLSVKLGLSRVGGNRKLYRQLVAKFGVQHADAATAIRQSLTAGDAKTAARLAHTLKSVAGNIGAEELSHAAGELERALKAGETQAAYDRLAAFEGLLQQVLRAVAALAGPGGEPEARLSRPALDQPAAAALLAELRDLLDADLGQAMTRAEALDALTGAAEIPPDIASGLAGLRQALDGFDTEAAAQAIDGLLAALRPA